MLSSTKTKTCSHALSQARVAAAMLFITWWVYKLLQMKWGSLPVARVVAVVLAAVLY